MPFSGVFTAPPIKPKPFGLFSAATVVDHTSTDERWVSGFGLDSETCNTTGSILDICSTDATYTFKEPATGLDPTRVYRPFGIRAEYAANTLGFTAIDGRARVEHQLKAMTEKAVETELLTGQFTTDSYPTDGGNPFLADSDTEKIATGSGTIDAATGVAILEQYYAECGIGDAGTLHLPMAVASKLGDSLEKVDNDKRLVTHAGTNVVAGSGYDGRGPGETSNAGKPLNYWIYITGPVLVHLGPIETMTPENSSIVNVRNNEATWVAVRPAIAIWDGCCSFAVRVSIS